MVCAFASQVSKGGTFPLAAQSSRLREDGWQTWSRALCFQDTPSTVYTQHLQNFLSTSSLMQWGNKSRGRGCRELLRAVQDSAGVQPHHNTCCPYLLLLLLGTLPMGRKSQDAFLSERRKQCWQVRWFLWSSLRHCSPGPLLHPEAQGKHCRPSLTNKPRAKLLKSLTRVPGAARSSSGTALC